MTRLCLVLACVALVGCPTSAPKANGDAGPTACTKIGQSCEFSPGKLGTCVQNDNCPSAAPCFTCQSQH